MGSAAEGCGRESGWLGWWPGRRQMRAEGARAEESTTPASMPGSPTTALPLASAAQLVGRSNGAAAEEAEEAEAVVEAEEVAMVEAAADEEEATEEATEVAAVGAFHQCSASRIARRVSACVNCI